MSLVGLTNVANPPSAPERTRKIVTAESISRDEGAARGVVALPRAPEFPYPLHAGVGGLARPRGYLFPAAAKPDFHGSLSEKCT